MPLRVGASEREELSYLRRRVGLYTRVAVGLVLTFLLLDMTSYPFVADIAGVPNLRHLQVRGLAFELTIAAALAATAWLVQRRQLSVVQIYAIDGLATLLVGSGFAGLVMAAPSIPLFVELFVFLAIQAILFVHAALVPAPALRTAVLHTATCVPIVIVAFIRKSDAHDAGTIWPEARFWFLVVWVLLFAGVGAVVSWVLHQLRLRVRRVERLGQYQLEHKIGSGAMGVVYRAHHEVLKRPTAVKVLPPDLAGEKAIARFEREVKQTSRLTHPNTVAIYDFGRTPDGVFYYAMELLDGLTLSQIVELGGPLPPARVVHVLRQCAGALAEAHELGLIHRDIKPDNIVMCRRGGVEDTVKVVDFGLVKILDSPRDPKLSGVDSMLGTPLFMAPEVMSDPDIVDARADLYSLGVVAYYLLTGSPPFTGKTLLEVCSAHLRDAPPSLAERAHHPVEDELESIVARLLEKEPGARFSSARALEDALAQTSLAGRWTRADADAWWEAHRESSLKLHRLERVEQPALEIAIESRQPSSARRSA